MLRFAFNAAVLQYAVLCCDLQVVTWYYASPTMHMGILDAVKLLDHTPPTRVRLIANAAGVLGTPRLG